MHMARQAPAWAVSLAGEEDQWIGKAGLKDSINAMIMATLDQALLHHGLK